VELFRGILAAKGERMKRASASIMSELAEAVHDLIASAVVDVGEVFVGHIGNHLGGDDIEAHEKRRDAWVHFVDALTEHRFLGFLYQPAGILFRKPRRGETAYVVRGRHMMGPGGPLVVPMGGDGEREDVLPPWFDDKAGLWAKGETLRIHAKDAPVELQAEDADLTIEATGNGKVRLGSSNRKPVVRKGDKVDIGYFFVTPGTGGISAITWVPPGGGEPVVLSSSPPTGETANPFYGEVAEGSDKVEAE